MKAFLSMVSLVLRGYSERDVPIMQKHADTWEVLYQQYLMRGDSEQAKRCKEEVERHRRIIQHFV